MEKTDKEVFSEKKGMTDAERREYEREESIKGWRDYDNNLKELFFDNISKVDDNSEEIEYNEFISIFETSFENEGGTCINNVFSKALRITEQGEKDWVSFNESFRVLIDYFKYTPMQILGFVETYIFTQNKESIFQANIGKDSLSSRLVIADNDIIGSLDSENTEYTKAFLTKHFGLVQLEQPMLFGLTGVNFD